MKNNFRGKIRDFMKSEDGKVGIKSPLALGVTAGAVLLASAVIGTPDAEANFCWDDEDCDPGKRCHRPFLPFGSCGSA